MHLNWQPSTDLTGAPILTSVDPAESDELGRLAAGRRVLEIGSAHGYSAVVMALAGAEHVTAVDNHSGGTWLGDTRTIMEGNLGAYGVTDRVTIVQADSRDALAALDEQGERFGLIFIDGDHTRAGATADISGSLPLLEAGGVLAVHDYGETCCCPEVRLAVDAALGWMETRAAGTRAPQVVGTLWLKRL
jgi:cephalosporin hydroxylase